MRRSRVLSVSCVFLACIALLIPSTFVQAQPASSEAQAIRAVLDKQVVDWNRRLLRWKTAHRSLI